MGKAEQSRSYLAQGIVESLLNDSNVKNTILFHKNPITNKKELNNSILNLFLRVYSKNEKLFLLLKELNKKGSHLPDLLCLNPETNEPFFHEVKAEDRRLKFSDLRRIQKEAIKKIAKEGYTIHITNVRFAMKFKEDEKADDYTNKEEGRSLIEEIPRDKKVIVGMKSNELKETIYPNIFIQELEVTGYYGEVN